MDPVELGDLAGRLRPRERLHDDLELDQP
jgi:hypothetical protein